MYDDFSAFKEEVKNRIDIVDVIGEYLDLKKRSGNHLGLCPFHTEKTPSFNVNRSGQFYHCFGCGKGGDVIGFLMDITGMTFMEALEQLATRAGLEMPERKAEDSSYRQKSELISSANMTAAEYYHKTLEGKSGKAGLDYLLGRNLTLETIKSFRLGFSPVDPIGLQKFAKEKGVPLSAFEDAGILKHNFDGSYYNRFGGRVMFPIVDQAVRVIGFGARLLEGEGAKYLNSPESEVYHKSQVLFGIHQAKAAIKRERKAIVVEGYLDVLTLHQAGIENVISASGTAFTSDQGRIINRFAQQVTLLFDGDKAGISAAARGADNLLATDMGITVTVLPDGEDPDSYLNKHGLESLLERINSPLDFWEFKLKAFKGEDMSVEDKIKLAGEIADSISLIDDDIKRDIYIGDMSLKIGIDIDSMRKAVNGRRRRKHSRRSTEPVTAAPDLISREEQELLASLILYPGFAKEFMEEAGEKPFANPLSKAIAKEVFHCIAEGVKISPTSLMSGLPNRDIQQLVSSVAMIPVKEENAKSYFVYHIKRSKKKCIICSQG